MKKFLTLVVALVMAIPMMAAVDRDGSTQAKAIIFDWNAPMTHTGEKWYKVDLGPLYEEETPALNLFLANKDPFKDVDVSLQATVAGQSETKDYTIKPKQQKSWSANASMLVRLRQTEIYILLRSNGPVEMSARVFEAADLDETCKDALPLSWTTGITKPAGVPVWYKVDIRAAKANTAQDVCVIVTNNGSKAMTLKAGQSLDCPSSGVTKRTIELAAGATLRDTVPHSMINNVAYDELYVSLENDQPISVSVEYANRPAVKVLPDYSPAVYTDKHVPDTATHESDTLTLNAGVTYYFRYKVSELDALKKYEPEFTFRNPGTVPANIDRKMAFEAPAYVAQGNVLELPAGEEQIEVIAKNTLLGLAADYVYVKVTSDQDVQLISRFKHVREGKACKTNIDFGVIKEENVHSQEGGTTQWYAIDLDSAKNTTQDVIVYIKNVDSKSATVKASTAFACPYIDLMEVSRTIAAGETLHRRMPYSTYAMMATTVYIGLETNRNIKFWAKMADAEKQTVVDSICLGAKDFDWQEGDTISANTPTWFLIDMKKVRALAAKFPTVLLQNLSTTGDAKINAEMSLECPDSIKNESRSMTIKAGEAYSKSLSRDMFEGIKRDTIYLKITSTQKISLQIRLTEEAEGASCSSAVPFNWVSGNSQKANESFWYEVDLSKAGDHDIRLHMENKDNASCKGVIQLSYECPVENAPSIRNFSLTAAGTTNGQKAVTIQNSAFDMLENKIVYVNLQATTGLHFWAELLPLQKFDTITEEGLTLIPLMWDSLYTQTVDTAWYIVPTSEIDKIRNLDEKVKPVAHLINLANAKNTIKAEAAFGFPIVKKMMTKSQELTAKKHFTDTIPASTFEQVLKKDTIILRVTRPAGSGDFQFRAELVKAFSGNTRNDALPIRLGETYTQSPMTEMWYKINTADWKKDKETLYDKVLNVMSKSAGAGDAKVTLAVYEGLLSQVDKLEELGLEDYREKTIKKGQGKSHNMPAQALLALGDAEFYIQVKTTDSLVFKTAWAGTYAELSADSAAIVAKEQSEAKLLVPNVEYVVPGDNKEHWYAVCIPMIRNNYEYTADASLSYNLTGTAHIYGTFTFQDTMTCKMPVRDTTINHADTTYHGKILLSRMLNKAIKHFAHREFDVSTFQPAFVDSMLHRYVTNDSITAYIRLKTNQDLTVKLNMKQKTGDGCDKPMMFDWEHGNVNPAGADKWYLVKLADMEINGIDTAAIYPYIPDSCDLRLHVDNWGSDSSRVAADLYFDCNDPATVSKSYKQGGDGKDTLDIDRDLLVKMGWADMVINYSSEKVSHIWAEFIPKAKRDTLRDTINAYVCWGGDYLDTIQNKLHEGIETYTQWFDTVELQKGARLIDSITMFCIHPVEAPKVLSVDSMKAMNAAPLLVQGMQLYVDASNAALDAYYKNLGATVDTITKIDTVYWAKPVWKADRTLDIKHEAALDLTSYYPKTRDFDTLLLVIKADTCDVIVRDTVVFKLEPYKVINVNDTLCPAEYALLTENPKTFTITVDTLGLPRYADSIVTYYEYLWPATYTKDELVVLPSVAAGSAIDTTNAIYSLEQKMAADVQPLTMPVSAIQWQVKVGSAWQEAHGYNIPATATEAELRYVVSALCADTPSVSMHFDLTCKDDTLKWEGEPLTGCDTVTWSYGGQDYQFFKDTTYYHDDGEPVPGTGCHHYTEVKIKVNESKETTLDPVEACDSLYWAAADTTIFTSGTYTLKKTTTTGCDSIVSLKVTIHHSAPDSLLKATACNFFDWRGVRYNETGIYYDSLTTVPGGCDSVFVLDLTIKGTSFVDTLEVKAYYGYRIIMINRHQINALDGWADLDSLDNVQGKYITWYKMLGATPDVTVDDSVATGYYYTLASGDPLPAGDKYYAYIDLPASAGAECGSVGMTKVITIGVTAPAPALVPTLARPGENIKVLNLDPTTETTIRIYTADGILQGTYSAYGEETFVIRAASDNGFYLVEVSNDSMKSTLRYIVK